MAIALWKYTINLLWFTSKHQSSIPSMIMFHFSRASILIFIYLGNNAYYFNWFVSYIKLTKNYTHYKINSGNAFSNFFILAIDPIIHISFNKSFAKEWKLYVLPQIKDLTFNYHNWDINSLHHSNNIYRLKLRSKIIVV